MAVGSALRSPVIAAEGDDRNGGASKILLKKRTRRRMCTGLLVLKFSSQLHAHIAS